MLDWITVCRDETRAADPVREPAVSPNPLNSKASQHRQHARRHSLDRV